MTDEEFIKTMHVHGRKDESVKQNNEIRQFDTGASRDADDHPDKPSYCKALSPVVLREYVKYLGRHRTLPDGSKRDWDNWKKGMPLDVYLDGLLRHVWAVWLIQQGHESYDNHGKVTMKDSLNGVLFNTMGMLHEILQKDKLCCDLIKKAEMYEDVIPD